MHEQNCTVYLVDDEAEVLTALSKLLGSCGYRTEAFASPEQFLLSHDSSAPGCALIDLSMPGLDGLALQKALADKGVSRPIIFLSGRGSVMSSVQAMKLGAVDFLEKPFDTPDLLSAIERAVEADAAARTESSHKRSIQARLDR